MDEHPKEKDVEKLKTYTERGENTTEITQDVYMMETLAEELDGLAELIWDLAATTSAMADEIRVINRREG